MSHEFDQTLADIRDERVNWLDLMTQFPEKVENINEHLLALSEQLNARLLEFQTNLEMFQDAEQGYRQHPLASKLDLGPIQTAIQVLEAAMGQLIDEKVLIDHRTHVSHRTLAAD